MKVIRMSRSQIPQEDFSTKTREEIKTSLQDIVTLLTDSPEKIQVTCEIGDKTTVYNIECPKNYMGQILGAKGRNIQALRQIFAAITSRTGFRSVINVPYYNKEED